MYLIYQSICLRDQVIMSYFVSASNQSIIKGLDTQQIKELIANNKTYKTALEHLIVEECHHICCC